MARPIIMVPKIINFIWIGDNKLPDWAVRNIDEFKRLNPDYQIKICGEEILLDELKEKYAVITDITSKSDLLRYSALKRFGGWYFDCDFWPMRSIDDITAAYGVDGVKLFTSRQHGQRNGKLTFTNAVLAADKDCQTLDKIIDYINAAKEPFTRTSFGPQMITELITANPAEFIISDWPWFFPCDIASAWDNYQRILSGYCEIAFNIAPTGGQKPFAMHLWAGGKKDFENKQGHLYSIRNPQSQRLAGILANDIQAKNMQTNPDHPLAAAAEGLVKAGYRVEVRPTGFWPLFYAKPKLIIVWNGRRDEFSGTINKAELEGIPIIRMEHGFYDRSKHFQIDTQGILHWGSWTGMLTTPAPAEGKDRLKKVWPADIKKLHTKKNGYILVLGQVTQDTQLEDCEIKSGLQLDKAVYSAIKDLALTAYFRPHPKDRQYPIRNKYLPISEASTLAEAIEGARFAITINSNSGVECLALGCPVLAFGPATYLQANVARATSLKTLRKDIIEMSKAATLPAQGEVENYLYWLAANQWHLDEIKEGEIFKKLIA